MRKYIYITLMSPFLIATFSYVNIVTLILYQNMRVNFTDFKEAIKEEWCESKKQEKKHGKT